MSVTIQTEQNLPGDIVVARLTKPELPQDETFELDLLQSVALETALKQLTSEKGRKIVLNLAQVAYMDSKTFWAMVRAANSLRDNGGKLVVSNLHSNIARLLTLTGADEYLQAFETVEEASSALSAE